MISLFWVLVYVACFLAVLVKCLYIRDYNAVEIYDRDIIFLCLLGPLVVAFSALWYCGPFIRCLWRVMFESLY